MSSKTNNNRRTLTFPVDKVVSYNINCPLDEPPRLDIEVLLANADDLMFDKGIEYAKQWRFKLKEELENSGITDRMRTMSLLGTWREVLGEPDLTIDDMSDREIQLFQFQRRVLNESNKESHN